MQLITGDDSRGSGVQSCPGRFTVEQVTTGPHASGFGSTEDCRPFAFRVHKATLFLEIYRAGLSAPVPDRSDVTAVSEQSVTEIDLTDERSIIAAVRDAVIDADELRTGSGADGDEDTSAVRSFLGRFGSLIENI